MDIDNWVLNLLNEEEEEEEEELLMELLHLKHQAHNIRPIRFSHQHQPMLTLWEM